MERSNDFALRRTIQPYIALLIIWIGITFLWIFVTFKTHDLSGLILIALLWAIGVWGQYGNTRYRIFWESDAIRQIAANKNITTIKTSEITRIVQEQSDLQTLFSYTRPSRRIAIYSDGSNGHKWIDVSLKHFAADDIRRLMQAIRERRPDLSIPKDWL